MRSLTTTLLLSLSLAVAFANGDPVAVTSAITLSSSPVAVHVPEVQILNEQVKFVPNGKHTDVMVRYLLQNQSKKDFKELPYGFPIDYYGTGEARWGWVDDYSESRRAIGWRDDYVQNVVFSLDGRQLPWQCSKDTVIKPSQKVIAFDLQVDLEPDSADTYSHALIQKLYKEWGEELWFHTNPISRRWFYTRLDIPAGQTVMLEVRYTVEHFYQEGLYDHSDYFENYKTNYYCDGAFEYDFAPAAHWGNGKAQRFIAELDASHIEILSDEYYFRGMDRNHSGIQGLKMKKGANNVWRYEATDFDFATAKPFTVDFHSRQVTQPIAKILSHRVPQDRYTVTLSGADPKYPARNLSDGDLSTTTVLTADSAGKYYIIITVKDTNFTPSGILLYNGYCKNRDVWRNNSRIETMSANETYYCKKYNNHTQKWVADNQSNEVFNRWSHFYENGKRIDRPNKVSAEPVAFDWQNLTDNAIIFRTDEYSLWGYYANFGHIEKYQLRIDIGDIAPGQKYNDLCISEIILIR